MGVKCLNQYSFKLTWTLESLLANIAPSTLAPVLFCQYLTRKMLVISLSDILSFHYFLLNLVDFYFKIGTQIKLILCNILYNFFLNFLYKKNTYLEPMLFLIWVIQKPNLSKELPNNSFVNFFEYNQ